MSFSTQNPHYDPNQDMMRLAQQTNGKAVLFLFQPLARPFGDQAHRPLTYTISEDVLNAAREAAHLAHMGKSPIAAAASVTNRSDTLSSVLPSFMPTARVGLSELSTHWKFMLVINGDFLEPGQVAVFSRNNTTRELYFGYCIDEPINPTTLFMTEPTINDNCRMTITHKTVLQTFPSHSSQSSTNNYSTMLDADIIDPSLFTSLASTEMQLNDPLRLSQGSELHSGGGGTVWEIPQPIAANNLSNQITPIPVDNLMHVPQQNLSNIMLAAVYANRKFGDNRVMGFDNPFSDQGTRTDVLTESIESYFQSGVATAKTLGLRPDSTHMLGILRQKYRPDIFPYAGDKSVLFSPYDQTNRTFNSMFCSLLCSAIPPLMMKAQLLQFAFQYETRSYDTNQPDVPKVYSVHAAVPMSEHVLREKVHALINTLKSGLFRMLFEARGDFSVHGSFGVANVSHCYLNFYCDNERMLEPFEVPTIFGGLTSNLVADPQTTFNNTAQYGALMAAMTGSELQDFSPDHAPNFNTNGVPAVINNPSTQNFFTGDPLIPQNLFR